jgi:ActR/RegA family two-component response regulator
MITDEFDPRPRVERYVDSLVKETQRIARAPFAKQLEAGSLAFWEANHLARVLAACDGNKSEAARILQIDRRSLQRKLSRIASGGRRRKARRAKR